jgi:8-oxo-dGTP pyrophosphatase MutT (NUDIX family)
MERQFTATVYILQGQSVLLMYHRKYQKWLPPGGHVEANETPPEAARREVKEEIGLEIEFMMQENTWVDLPYARSFERPYLCLLEDIPAYQNKPAHQHMDFIYVAQPTLNQSDSSSSTETWRWFPLEEIKALKPGVDIFEDSLKIISHLFSHHENSLPYAAAAFDQLLDEQRG